MVHPIVARIYKHRFFSPITGEQTSPRIRSPITLACFKLYSGDDRARGARYVRMPIYHYNSTTKNLKRTYRLTLDGAYSTSYYMCPPCAKAFAGRFLRDLRSDGRREKGFGGPKLPPLSGLTVTSRIRQISPIRIRQKIETTADTCATGSSTIDSSDRRNSHPRTLTLPPPYTHKSNSSKTEQTQHHQIRAIMSQTSFVDTKLLVRTTVHTERCVGGSF